VRIAKVKPTYLGSVVAVNERKAMFIVEIDNGDFAVFELLERIGLGVGDRIRGNLKALGKTMLLHIDRNQSFRVYGQTGPSKRSVCESFL
jgi:hypothetical protein